MRGGVGIGGGIAFISLLRGWVMGWGVRLSCGVDERIEWRRDGRRLFNPAVHLHWIDSSTIHPEQADKHAISSIPHVHNPLIPGFAPYLLLIRRRTRNHNIKEEDCSDRQETRTKKGRDPILAISRVGGCCCELLILLEGVSYGDACGSNVAD